MKNETYSTSDLWLAAFLKTKGMKLVRIEGESKRAFFVFDTSENQKELIKEFYNDGIVGIATIKNTIADLKSAIFNMVLK